MSPSLSVRLPTADGTAIALHQVRSPCPRFETPIVLVPGTFSSRSFWLGTRGQGFARHLAAAGFDCWVAELRGHGAADRPARWTMHDWIRHDAPAAVAGVLERTGAAACYWVGHSAGGVVGAAAVGHDAGVANALRGLVLLGSPGPAGLHGARRAAAWATQISARLLPRARFPGAPLGLGPEHEPAPLIEEWMRWNLAGAWRTPHGGDYLGGLHAVDVPLLAVAGAADHLLAPVHAVRDLVRRFGSRDRTLMVAGMRQGFRRDYGHADLIVGGAAREEIWPLVRDWLVARAVTRAYPGVAEPV